MLSARITHCFILVIAATTFTSLRSVFAQYTNIDQTRSLSVQATGNFGTQQNQQSDTNTSLGTYNNTLTVTKTDNQGTPFNYNWYYNLTSSATQNTVVSSSGFGGTGSATDGGGEDRPNDTNETGLAESISSFNVDFSVSAPTPLVLTGSIFDAPPAAATEGPFVNASGYATLTDDTASSTLYSVSDDTLFSISGGLAYNSPLAYSATLIPGHTYTFTIQSQVNCPTNWLSVSITPTASFSFVAAVPEPASVSVLVAVTTLLLGRRRR